MFDFVGGETGFVISLLIQPHNQIDIILLKYRYIILRCEHPPSIWVLWCRTGSTKCQEPPRNDSIHISVFHALIKVVGVEVKAFHVEPAEFYCSFEAL